MAAAIALPGRRADFTFAHAGRQVRLGPIAFWIVVGTLVIMAGWTIITATYFAFRDDVLTRLISRQAQMQYAYEDRIADMRAQVDRVTSRQLLDQEQVEQKLDSLLRRQATLETRAAMLGHVIDPATTGSIHHGRASVSDDGSRAHSKPSPISDAFQFPVPNKHRAGLRAEHEPSFAPMLQEAKEGGIEAALAKVEISLDRVEAHQIAALDSMEEHYDGRARQVRTVLAGLGVDTTHLHPEVPRDASGGPFVPIKPPTGGSFESELYHVNVARAQVDRLQRSLADVPLRHPISGELDMTSPFGERTDPFLGVPAMHTGDDFRAPLGDAVYATASGTVSVASYTGGYGRMVEIHHGANVVTRYGHLSTILVRVGQRVKVGQIVGRVGSTGRATGPHLHYETRVNGEAVDPQKFLRAGTRLGAAE